MQCKVCGDTKGPFAPFFNIHPILTWESYNGWGKREYICSLDDDQHWNAIRGIADEANDAACETNAGNAG